MEATLRDGSRESAYISSRGSRLLARALVVVGIGVAVAGVVYAGLGAAEASDTVTVPISIADRNDDALSTVQVSVDDVAVPEGARLEAVQGGLQLVDENGASAWAGFLARGDAALLGLAFAACALLVAPVITSVASGEPFRKGNAVRIAWTGMVVGVVGMLAPTLPHLAALGVMTSFDGLGDNPLAVVVTPSVVPVGIAALILIVAEAFRRGTQINDDVAGLV